MKKTIFLALFILLVTTLAVQAADSTFPGDLNGTSIRSIKDYKNITFINYLCQKGQGCFNASNFSGGGSGPTYLAGNCIFINGTTLNVNQTCLNALNDTSLIEAVNSSLQTLTAREAANNATQATLINAKLQNGSAANLSTLVVVNNVTAQNIFAFINWSYIQNIPSYVIDWSGIIQAVNSSLIGRINAVNSTVVALDSRENLNNATQASQIASEVALQASNNATQATLITAGFANDSAIFARQSADNTTLTNTKAAAGNCGPGFAVQNATSGAVQCIALSAGANGTTYTAGNGINITGSVISLNDTYVNARWNETGLINSVNSSLQTEITLQAANNATQAALINTKGNASSGYCPAGQFQNGSNSTNIFCGTPVGGGSGGGNVTSQASTGFIPLMGNSTSLNNSLMSQSGNAITVARNLSSTNYWNFTNNGTHAISNSQAPVYFTTQVSVPNVTVSGLATGKAICVRTDGNFGVCTSAVGAGGDCTCV